MMLRNQVLVLGMLEVTSSSSSDTTAAGMDSEPLMEFHMKSSGNSRKDDPKRGAETVFQGTTTPLGSTVDNYGAFQSKDPIISISKDNHKKSHGDPGHGPNVHHPTSYLETMMHLFKGNVGSGIFALGDAFKNAGLFLAPPLTIILGIICVHAQHMLINCNEEVCRRMGTSKDARPGFAGTVEMCFETGPLSLRKYSVKMRKLVNIFLCATQLGFCCVYFVFISTNMKQVLDGYGLKMNVHLHMVVVLIPILLSTWIRNLKYLVPISSMANFLVLAGYILSVYLMSQDLPPIHERKYVADWKQIPLFFGTVIYSFEGITLVLPLKNEMKTPEKFSKPLGVLNVGMVIVGSMFVLMGFLSFLKYGDNVAGSVTLNLDSKDVVPSWLPQFIQIAISLSILLTYALQFYVPIAITWPAIADKFGPFRWPVASEIGYRSAVCVFTFILAEAIPQLGLFISLVGAVSSTALALIFPPIMEIVMCSQQASPNRQILIKDLSILLIGVLGCVTGTYQSIAEIVEYFSSQ